MYHEMFVIDASFHMFFIPMFFIWTIYNIKQHGLSFGTNKAWKTFEYWWNKEPTLQDPEVFKSQSDDML